MGTYAYITQNESLRTSANRRVAASVLVSLIFVLGPNFFSLSFFTLRALPTPPETIDPIPSVSLDLLDWW